MSSKPYTAPRIWEYLTKRPGSTVYIGEIEEATGLSEDQVRSGIARMRRDPAVAEEILVVHQGHAWRYMPHRPGGDQEPGQLPPGFGQRAGSTTTSAAKGRYAELRDAMTAPVSLRPAPQPGPLPQPAPEPQPEPRPQLPPQPQPVILMLPLQPGQQPRLFRELGSLPDGAVALMGGDGKLYRAELLYGGA